MPEATAAPKAPVDLFPDLESESVDCFLCGESQTRTLFEGRGFEMGQCTGCGFVRQNPRLTESALIHGHYDGAAQKHPPVERPADMPVWITQHMGNYTQSVDAVLRHWPADREKGRWIDIGASGGALLVAAHDAGFEPAGVEVGEAQARMCREEHGFDVFHGTLEQAQYPAASASVISFRHVLEHLHDALGALKESRRVLRDDGMLLIEVPNYSGLKYALGRLRRPFKLGKDYWLGANIPEHLYYFTPRSLERALKMAGFKVLGHETYGKFRPNRKLTRKAYDAVRDGLRIGNKMRVVAAAQS